MDIRGRPVSGVTVYAQGLVSELACRLLTLALDPTVFLQEIQDRFVICQHLQHTHMLSTVRAQISECTILLQKM